MADIERIADATGKGKYLPIAVDGRDSFAWPWAWYLRDYKCVAYPDLSAGVVGRSLCQGEDQPYAVLLVNKSSETAVQQWIDDNEPATYGVPFVYPHRWWFPETYKDAVQVNGNFSCTGRSGDCSPRSFDTWKVIAKGIFGGSWPGTWYDYWRDHDPDLISGATGDRRCNSCGSVDALAYFPSEYDRTTRVYAPADAEPPHPTVDVAGRPEFGGRGSQPGNLVRPTDIETDTEGNLYVIDQARRMLTKFDADGNVIASVDVRTAGDTAEESQPWGLGLAPDGRIVVADTFGWRIRVFDATLHLEGVYGETPRLAAGEPPGLLELYGPRDVAVDSLGHVWITDTGQDRLLVFDLDGNPIRAIGTEGSGPGEFNEPVGISIASDGTIWVADAYNARVVALDAQGQFLGAFPVDGWGGADAEDKPYIRALSDGRIAVTLPVAGEVRIYTRDGVLDGTINPQDVPLDRPYGVVEGGGGTLWVVEGGASRVRKFVLP
ncbi:MAG: NHL repeat-containing protein [Dehalococcoidia bacterium]